MHSPRGNNFSFLSFLPEPRAICLTYRIALPLLLARLATQAVAGTLHNVMNGLLGVEFDASLMLNEELLGRVAASNAGRNEMRTGTPTRPTC